MTDRGYQIRSGIYGVCVGDALGVSAEFRKKDAAIIYEITLPVKKTMDMRDCVSATWRDVLRSVFEEQDKRMTLSKLYHSIDRHRRCETNPYWKEKIRQTLYSYPKLFTKLSDGSWKLAAA